MSETTKKDLTPGTWNANLPDSIFNKGVPGRRALTFAALKGQNSPSDLPAEMRRNSAVDLPSLSEGEVMRHFTALSNLNHHIERGMYPLGSCTMKFNLETVGKKSL